MRARKVDDYARKNGISVEHELYNLRMTDVISFLEIFFGCMIFGFGFEGKGFGPKANPLTKFHTFSC